MKTTLDLPTDLVQRIKLRAVSEGRKPEDVAADILQAGLTPASAPNVSAAAAVPKTLPVIKVHRAPRASTIDVTAQQFCERIKQADLDLEVERYEKAVGHQCVDRHQS